MRSPAAHVLQNEQKKRCEYTTIEIKFMAMVTGIKNFIFNHDEQCHLKARIVRGWCQTLPAHRIERLFFYFSYKMQDL